MYLMNQSATHFLENVHVFNHFAGLCAFFLTIAGWKVTAGYMWRRLCDVCSLYVCVCDASCTVFLGQCTEGQNNYEFPTFCLENPLPPFLPGYSTLVGGRHCDYYQSSFSILRLKF